MLIGEMGLATQPLSLLVPDELHEVTSEAALPCRSRLWLLASDESATEAVAECLGGLGGAQRSAFLVSGDTGEPLLRFGDVLALASGAALRLFVNAAEPLSVSGGGTIAAAVERMLRRGPSDAQQAVAIEAILIRLWGNARAVTDGHAGEGPLGQMLGQLQSVDQGSNPHLFRSTVDEILSELDEDASPALSALLHRLKARALLDIAGRRTAFPATLGDISLASYSRASAAFSRAHFASLAHACRRDRSRAGTIFARYLAPELPGLQAPVADMAVPTAAMPRRLAFRAFRCLAVSLDGPEMRIPGHRRADALLRPAGSIEIAPFDLAAVLAGTRSESYAPRVILRRLPDEPDRLLARVLIDDEHRHLFGLPGVEEGGPRRRFLVGLRTTSGDSEPGFAKLVAGIASDFAVPIPKSVRDRLRISIIVNDQEVEQILPIL